MTDNDADRGNGDNGGEGGASCLNKVLIVDDDRFSRILLGQVFTNIEYSVVEAADGDEALAAVAAADDFSVIVSDMNMPVMSGLELIKRLRGVGVTIPIIVLTGNRDVDVAIEALQGGANGYVIKDENIGKTITVAVNEALEKAAIKRHNQRLLAELSENNHQLKTALDDLKQAQAQILQQEKMATIGILAAGVAHEINNPIGFVKSNITSLGRYFKNTADFLAMQSKAIGKLTDSAATDVEGVLDDLTKAKGELNLDFMLDDADDLLKESMDGVERIRVIVQNIRGFSRSNDDEFRLSGINSALDTTLNILSNELKYKVTLERDYGDIPDTYCNIGTLNQAFMNIIHNASQSIEKKGVITIKTWHDDGCIFIGISDTGCGIPDEALDKLFDPFFTTKDVGEGTGLGLSIVYNIIKEHHGDITVVSGVGRGSTFTIRLPVVAECGES